ncbi:MAG TPA: bifunctional enoyl-CoA hydratase/phosphate acetyltransferase [Terriglobia bacterium]|nr:bifunctional enoyl-CoA hydratase/phosphate acetyltransferase [Terriglobia bacterium]
MTTAAGVTEGSLIENRTFEEITIGESASIVHRLSRADIELFAVMSGDVNPAHLDEQFAARSLFHHVVAHGMWSGALFSAVLGTKLPGPGTIYLGQDLHFLRPIQIDDTVTVTVAVREKHPEKHIVVFDCRAVNQAGVEAVRGTAEVKAPTEKIRLLPAELPEVELRHHDRFRKLIERCHALAPVVTAVVHPCDGATLAAVREAAEAGLIQPVLVGPEAKIRAAAEAAGINVTPFRLVSTPHSHAAAAEAVNLVRTGQAQAIMQGSLHTSELLPEVTAAASGLRTGRLMTHVFLLDVPSYSKPLLLTDAAINFFPTLPDKKEICQNAIEVAQAIGIAEPKVAILAAVETVSEKLPSTLDAAALCKMADRGQITGGIVDGPLAFDNAVSPEAARLKGITSRVAGNADILVVRDLEEGSLLVKQLAFFAGAEAAGIVVGARVPIILANRADGLRSRLTSCAAAVLLAEAARCGTALISGNSSSSLDQAA